MRFHAELDYLAEFMGAAPILADLLVAAADSQASPFGFERVERVGVPLRPFSVDVKARIFLPQSRDNSVSQYSSTAVHEYITKILR
jgi:hypothetical protein